MNTRGTEMPNHRKHSANRVPNGTAPEDFWPQIRMFRQKKMPKQTPAAGQGRGGGKEELAHQMCSSANARVSTSAYGRACLHTLVRMHMHARFPPPHFYEARERLWQDWQVQPAHCKRASPCGADINASI